MTEKKEITLRGKKYPVAFTMTTVLSYEEIADRSFFGEQFQRIRERMMLIFAALYAADPKADITMEDIMGTDDWAEFNAAFDVVMKMATEFFKVPKVTEELEPEPTDDKKAKN